MRRNFLHLATLALCLSAGTVAFGQNVASDAPPAAPAFGIKFGGYVKADYFYDSRQTLTLREGDVLGLPAAYAADKSATPVDKNAVPQVGFTAIQTRLHGDITGPDFFKFKTSGVIEGEFLGPDNTVTEGSFRLRHAYVTLTGASTEMVLGQTWHPFYSPDCAPGTYNFSTGWPFSTFARNPQFKISTVGATRVFASVIAERDFADSGPAATSPYANTNLQPALQKNSGLPIFAAGFTHSSGAISVGLSATLKTIRPTIVDFHGDATTTNVSSTAFCGYFKYKGPNVTFKIGSIYGSNLSELLMAGGYAVSDTLTAVGGVKDNLGKAYTPISSLSSWAELSGTKGNFEWGLFAGYLTTIGSADPITAIGKNADGTPAGAIFGFSFMNDIMNAYRISPRIGWKSGKTRLGVELDYTSATRGEYNLTANNTGMTELASNATQSNFRVMFSAQYSF